MLWGRIQVFVSNARYIVAQHSKRLLLFEFRSLLCETSKLIYTRTAYAHMFVCFFFFCTFVAVHLPVDWVVLVCAFRLFAGSLFVNSKNTISMWFTTIAWWRLCQLSSWVKRFIKPVDVVLGMCVCVRVCSLCAYSWPIHRQTDWLTDWLDTKHCIYRIGYIEYIGMVYFCVYLLFHTCIKFLWIFRFHCAVDLWRVAFCYFSFCPVLNHEENKVN